MLNTQSLHIELVINKRSMCSHCRRGNSEWNAMRN